MRKKVFAGAFALAMVAGMATPLLSTGAVDAAPAGKTTICHRTRSEKNPFVIITVSNNALAAHGAHDEPDDVIPAGAGQDCRGEE